MIFLTVGLKNFNPTETQKVNKEEKRELHFLNAVPHHSVLKASKCTINRYRYMANPSKENFQVWWDTTKGITQAVHQQGGNCAGTSDRECTWRCKNPFFPYALWLSPFQTSSRVVLYQHGSLLCSIFMGSVPCCRALLALTSSLWVLPTTFHFHYRVFNDLHNALASGMPIYKKMYLQY